MLIDQLSTAYRCHCSIGNSNDLKKMIHEVLKTFVSETYAIYGHFCLINEDGIYEDFDSFGKINDFDFTKYNDYNGELSVIYEEKFIVLKIVLDNAFLFLLSKHSNIDCSFCMSMFESLIPKLNHSVNACINYNKLKKSNYLLEKQKEELINANKIKDVFLANMSHELKTPLNSITIISKIMSENKDNKLDSVACKNITTINKCAKDLTELINDILDISKIEAGELKINKDNISLKSLIEDMYDLFSPLAKEKEIELVNSFQIKNDIFFTDEHRTKQIIKNLLSNAIKFTKKGKVEISSKEFEDFYEISIIDTGIGIAKNNLDYVFDRFKQVDDITIKKPQGTGLGLAISKELASLLNGQVCAASELGIGSTFIYIIYKKANNKQVKSTNISKNEKKEEKHTFTKELLEKNIFLYHSNSLDQFNLTVKLKKYGLNIIPILNEEKLKEKIKEIDNKNYLVLLDTKVENLKNIVNNKKLTESNFMILKEGESIDNLIENLKSVQLFEKGE